MEGNEIEIAASLYACKKGKELRMNDEGASDRDEYLFIGTSALAFKAGANWQKERENAELAEWRELAEYRQHTINNQNQIIAELRSGQVDFARWIMNTPINGRTLEKLWDDYQWQRALNEDNEVRKEAFHQRLP